MSQLHEQIKNNLEINFKIQNAAQEKKKWKILKGDLQQDKKDL